MTTGQVQDDRATCSPRPPPPAGSTGSSGSARRGGHRRPDRGRAGLRGVGARRRRVRGPATAARATHWVGGAKVLVERRAHRPLRRAADAADQRGPDQAASTTIDQDAPWRTRPGTPLVGGAPRTYTRRGDVRRLVDHARRPDAVHPGARLAGAGPSPGGVAPERSETMLSSYVMDLPDVHRAEAAELKAARQGHPDRRTRSSGPSRSEQRATAAILGDLQSDERVLVPSANDWDAEGCIAGLPVTAGIGRLVDLRTGEIVLDARTRRVSRSLGAPYDDGPGGDLKLLWELGARWAGRGSGSYKYITDLEGQMGTETRSGCCNVPPGRRCTDGAASSGDTDAVFVLKGPARSGKSTFAECLLKVAGQYGKAQNHNLLFGDRGNPEFTDAAIYGYRVMTLSEPPMHAPAEHHEVEAALRRRLDHRAAAVRPGGDLVHPGVLAVADDQPRAGGRRRGGLAADEVLPVRALLGGLRRDARAARRADLRPGRAAAGAGLDARRCRGVGTARAGATSPPGRRPPPTRRPSTTRSRSGSPTAWWSPGRRSTSSPTPR